VTPRAPLGRVSPTFPPQDSASSRPPSPEFKPLSVQQPQRKRTKPNKYQPVSQVTSDDEEGLVVNIKTEPTADTSQSSLLRTDDVVKATRTPYGKVVLDIECSQDPSSSPVQEQITVFKGACCPFAFHRTSELQIFSSFSFFVFYSNSLVRHSHLCTMGYPSCAPASDSQWKFVMDQVRRQFAPLLNLERVTTYFLFEDGAQVPDNFKFVRSGFYTLQYQTPVPASLSKLKHLPSPSPFLTGLAAQPDRTAQASTSADANPPHRPQPPAAPTISELMKTDKPHTEHPHTEQPSGAYVYWKGRAKSLFGTGDVPYVVACIHDLHFCIPRG